VRLIAEAGKQVRIRLGRGKLGKRAHGQFHFYALERPRREFTTGPVRVPTGAQLTVALAVSAIAQKAGAGPTTFRLSALHEGSETVLLTESIDAKAGGRWLDRRVSLSELSGREVRFRFETKASRFHGSGRSAAFPLWGSPEILAPTPRRSRHNLILISLDTVRADALGGETRGARLSPWFDRLATEGTSFRQAVSTYASTAGAHMSLFTSTYANRHRVRTAANRLTDEITTFPQVLASAGYSNGAVTENAMILASSGFARGFDQYKENRDSLNHAGSIDTTFGDGLRWLEQHREELFFLFLHTYEAHDPYQPKPEALAAVPDLKIADDASEKERRWLTAQRAYEAEVHYADGALERLFSDLRRLDLADDTLVVITSDHGEEFGEHGALGHVRTVYDEVLRVPLLFWGPQIVPGGKIVDNQLSLVDVAPTLMDLLDLPVPDGFAGKSVAGLIRGEALDLGPRFAETTFQGIRIVAARTETHKWIWMDNGEPLRVYDLRTDPLERIPLNDPALMDRGRALLDEYDRQEGDLLGEPARRGGLLEGNADTPVLDEAVREKLRALGYLQ
jgi:arylsulfatase A-like enzyme